MPVLRSGTFVLYGITIANPSTLTDGLLLSPPDADHWYISNTGSVFTSLPCDPQWSPPTLLDTSTEGNGWPAGAPPPGFVPKFVSAFISPSAGPDFTLAVRSELSGLNVGNTWSMAGSGSQPISVGAVNIYHGPGLDTYAELLEFMEVHIEDMHAGTFISVLCPKVAASTPTSGPRIQGSYDIVAFWWIKSVLPRAATSGNSTLDGLTVGDVLLNPGDRVLVAEQADPAENGVYVVLADESWSRVSTDTDVHVSVEGVDECGNPVDVIDLVLADEAPSAEYEQFDPNDVDAAPHPVILSLEPNHGRAGTRVAIIGYGFGAGANVQFDGVDAVDIDVISQYRIEATAPAHANGFANVQVINADGVTS